jgi:hypothetical protein
LSDKEKEEELKRIIRNNDLTKSRMKEALDDLAKFAKENKFDWKKCKITNVSESISSHDIQENGKFIIYFTVNNHSYLIRFLEFAKYDCGWLICTTPQVFEAKGNEFF